MPQPEQSWPWGPAATLLLCFVIAASLLGWCWAWPGAFDSCQRPAAPDEWLTKTAATLDATVDLWLKIAITLIGTGSAVLVGVKDLLLRLTPVGKMLILCAMLLFGQSAIAGVVWKWRLANSWYNQCLGLIATDYMQPMFFASVCFFGAGIAAILVWIFAAVSPAASK